MDGRNSPDNHVCGHCMSKLTPYELNQMNPTLSEGQVCRLCQVEQCRPEAFTKPFCDFLQENPTVFHTVDYFKRKLSDSRFEEVCNAQPINVLDTVTTTRIYQHKQHAFANKARRSSTPENHGTAKSAQAASTG